MIEISISVSWLREWETWPCAIAAGQSYADIRLSCSNGNQEKNSLGEFILRKRETIEMPIGSGCP